MKFVETKIRGSFVLEPERREDSRGFFTRTFCKAELEKHGLNANIAQANLSFNHKKGTLRGMHLQNVPHAENKLVACPRGALYDVIVDLRKGSPTYKEWLGVELSEENQRALYVPEGCAHGFITLTDDCAASYLVTQFYKPEAEGGYRYDDPAFGIAWPLKPACINDKDKNWPDYIG
ncbi:MAG: dTDP-4-dehydrorhamnose 3,5-epimerase [Elusimicrobia bacterium RIFCSPLOWO2_01_FULL_54_10]|nr:MAG: dTDP-4-dehydrorhamnose 3,5-epimerase [Elusimicrobia bacterium RIFCSPLOWO2_01_FULL_54_10]